MLTVSLFLGFPIDAFYAAAFEKIDPQVLKLFIGTGEQCYLNEVTFEGIRYVGKFAGDLCSIPDLELLEKNIYSILNKIVPHHPSEGVPLVLFAAPSSLI